MYLISSPRPPLTTTTTLPSSLTSYCGNVSWEPHKISLKTTRSAEANLWAPFILITTLWERFRNAICVIVSWTDRRFPASLVILVMRRASCFRFGFFSSHERDIKLSTDKSKLMCHQWECAARGIGWCILCSMGRVTGAGENITCVFICVKSGSCAWPEWMQTMGHHLWNLNLQGIGPAFTDGSGLILGRFY